MKKFLVLILAIVLSLTVFACGGEGGNGGGKKDGIYFENETFSILQGRTGHLNVKAEENYKGDTDSLEWTSSDESVLTVTDATIANLMSGEVKGIKVGTATVTAKTSNGKKATIEVKVLAKLAPSKSTVSVMQNMTVDFPLDSIEGVTFESKNTAVATVSIEGVITGVAEGETVIVAKNALSSCEVVVVVNKVTLPIKTNAMSVVLGEPADFPLDDISGLTFTVADATVLSVNTEGKMTGLKKGETTVTATKGHLSETISVGVLESKEQTVTLTETADERFNFFGRTNFVAGKGQSFYYGASGFDVTFYGTQLKAKLSASSTTNGENKMSIFVDDESMTNASLDPDGNRVISIKTTAKDYTLVSGLTEGWHTVKVRKRTPFQSGDKVFGYVSLNSLTTDGYIGHAKNKSEFRIDFYGDSITNGYGNLTDGATENVSNTDANMTYASILANKLGVSHNIISASGWGIAWRNNGQANHAIPEQYDKLHIGSSVTYGADGASVIVINLGTNDALAISSHGKTIAEFKEKYTAFLTKLRTANPDAHIFCVYGMMGTSANVMTAINEVVMAMSDSKIYSHNLAKTSTTGHPLVSGHKQSALELETLLKSKGIID